MSDQLTTEKEIREYMIELVRLGVPKDEAVALVDKLTQGPLDPALDAAIELVPKGTDHGWWKTPGGWVARLRFKKWRAEQKRLYAEEGGSR